MAFRYWIIQFTALLFLSYLSAEELSEAKQYNNFAKKYSDVFVENNQDSITAYFRHLDIPLVRNASA